MARTEEADRGPFGEILDASADIVTVHSAEGTVLYESPSAARILGFKPGFLKGKSALRGVHPRDWERARNAFLSLVRGDSATHRGVFRLRRADGGWQPFEVVGSNLLAHADVRGIVMVSTALTNAQLATRILGPEAGVPPVHALVGATLITERSAQAIARARETGHHVVLMAIDLSPTPAGTRAPRPTVSGSTDGMDVLNRLNSMLRNNDAVFSLSDSRVVVLLAEVTEPFRLDALAARMQVEIRDALTLSGRNNPVRPNFSSAVYPRDAASAEALLERALNGLKTQRKVADDLLRRRTKALNKEPPPNPVLSADLRGAQHRGEFELYYQPKVDLMTGMLSGAEALLRWRHPGLGLISPSTFIPLAERNGLIGSIGLWVVRAVCDQVRHWHDQGMRLRVGVNLSAAQFRQTDLAVEMVNTVRGAGVDPNWLDIELTETAVMEDPDHAVDVLRKLKLAGMRIAIDDFGTGYASLAQLKHLPIDAIKIDQVFVRELQVNRHSTAIVKALIDLSLSLGIDAIAEGVETDNHSSLLASWGCRYGQGFFFGHPMTAKEFAARALRH